MRREDFSEMAETQESHWWFKGKRRIINKLINKCVFNGTPMKILEIGSGTGANLPVLAQYGNVTAMELDNYARSFINQRENISVVKGYLPDGLESVDGEKFNLVCIFDVLEHVEKDSEAVQALKNLLDHDGKILITVPAYQWLYSVHDKNLGHYRRYTRKNLCELCEKNGLKILYSGYMNTFLFPLMMIARFADKILSKLHKGGLFWLKNSGLRLELYS
ncbi:MAG: class I SAM-dependent methyltransferase [Synergistaceae bacterium]|nr:class I SAM-dependent methyltransferase [Synergistaceae bacterium]